MRLNRVYMDTPVTTGAELQLPEASAYHVARVLRLRAGAPLVIFDGGGGDYRCEVTAVEGDRVRVRALQRLAGLVDSPLGVTLVQAVSRSERMDWTLQKATELGVRAIVPVISSRSVVRLDDRQAAAKLRHWRGIVVAACEQCGRSTIPELRLPVELGEFLASAPREGQRLVLSPVGQRSLAGLASASARIELLIGPEGGLEDDELNAAQYAGFGPVRLGPRVLRTETAAVAALAILQALWGDLQ
jgi:16S rRNA (uracil1498-N3)-methyltransferase